MSRNAEWAGTAVLVGLVGWLGMTGVARGAIFDAAGAKLPDRLANTSRVHWAPLDRHRDGVTGVGVLGAPAVGDLCTATLIDTGVPAGPAYVLSNGHCNYFAHLGFDFLKSNEVRRDQKTRYHVTFHHFAGVPRSARLEFPLRALTYVTEHLTDVAIYQVGSRSGDRPATIQELGELGIRPVRLAAQRPRVGSRVRLVGALLYFPGMSILFPPSEIRTLYVSQCSIGRTVALKNGDYSAPSSVAHQCSSMPGFSGGPLLAESGEMVLLNSHGTADESEKPDCSYEDRPCEVNSDGTYTVRPELNYGQYVDIIAGCFDGAGAFELTAAGCGLPRPVLSK